MKFVKISFRFGKRLEAYNKTMKTSDHASRSLISAVGVAAYIALLVLLMSNLEHIVPEKNMLGPILMLIVFVISASVTGALVLGKPIMLYLDGAKKHAFTLFFWTVGWLVLFALVLLAILVA